MRNRLAALTLAAMMMFQLTACGAQNTNPPPAEEKGTEAADNTAENTGKTENTPDAEPAGTEKGELEEKLVIYSTHGEDLLEYVADAFTEKTGVAVEFINLKGELADRVRAESANPQADIMYGGASSLFIEMSEEGLFQPTQPAWAKDLDGMFKASDGSWYGTIQTPVMMFYNTEMLTAEEAPKDWSDLADPKYAGKIVSRDSVSSSIRSTLMSLVYQYEKEGKLEDAWTYLKGLDSNIKNYYNSGTMQFQAVGKQEAAISFGVLSSITDNIEKNSMPLAPIDAASGSVIITDGIAAIKNAPHPNAAAAFVEFAGSAELGASLANEFSRIPTLKAALADCPAWMQTEYKAMDVDWSVIAANQSEWLQKWTDEICDNSKVVSKE